MDSTQKSQLNTFVQRFPSMTYARGSDEFLEFTERTNRVHISDSFRSIFNALILPGDFPDFRVATYTHWTPRTDNTHPIWYTGDWGYANDQERSSLLQAHMFPVAQWVETGFSSLAINISDDTDSKVYEFTSEDILDDIRGNLSPDSSVFPAFSSYPEMISHIIELRLPDGTLVQAR
ncbi:hypothetical protein WEB32_31070 [Streptomyces netropsis]|uniref:hypothetical protein n=1 Tax=Streptomyces netropsis TaxID=55404 RepID=UPI0030CF8A9B